MSSNASMATMPPSPWLSARMIRIAYLADTMTTSAQKMSDRMPRMDSGVGAPPTWIACLSA